MFDATRDDDGTPAVVLRVHVQPGAGRSAVVGRHGTALKVRVAAPPVGGRANDACAELLADAFGVRPAQVELVGGRTSRAKQFRISGIDVDDFTRLLEHAVGDGRAGAGPNSPKSARH
ncbi:MAG: DUF167 domain-containing protein [Actinomycetota bacterium]|nr:DUF167 domain-containing protein [Actinomycetota bacterium]